MKKIETRLQEIRDRCENIAPFDSALLFSLRDRVFYTHARTDTPMLLEMLDATIDKIMFVDDGYLLRDVEKALEKIMGEYNE